MAPPVASCGISPQNKLSAVEFLFCFNVQSVSVPIKVCEFVARVSNNLNPDEKQSYSASHPDPWHYCCDWQD